MATLKIICHKCNTTIEVIESDKLKWHDQVKLPLVRLSECEKCKSKEEDKKK